MRMSRKTSCIKPPVLRGLYAVTPDRLDTSALLSMARQALAGGARILQYRNKSAAPALRIEQAAALQALTAEGGASFIVNDDAWLAAHVNADGVHLGAEDGSIAEARALLGGDKIIGCSCYNRLSLAHRAVEAGADYVAFGAFFPSAVKPGAAVADVCLLQQAREELNVPLVAIGGIDLGNGRPLIHAGADMLAVVSALFGAPDITATARAFSSMFDPAGRPGKELLLIRT